MKKHEKACHEFHEFHEFFAPWPGVRLAGRLRLSLSFPSAMAAFV